MIDEQEQDLKTCNDFLLNQLYDLLGMATHMSGNLECVVYIRKNCSKTSKKKLKQLEKIFLIIEKISQQLQELVNEAEKISFDYIELTKKEDKKSNENIPLNNIIIFPLEQNDDLYVYPDEKLTGIFKKNRDDES